MGVTLNVAIIFGYQFLDLAHEYVPIEFPLNCQTNVPHNCSQWRKQMQISHAIGHVIVTASLEWDAKVKDAISWPQCPTSQGQIMMSQSLTSASCQIQIRSHQVLTL